MSALARLVSIVFSPLVILLLTPYLLVEKVSNNPLYSLKWALVSYVFIFAVVIFIFLGVIFGIFSNFDVSKQKERPMLFSFVGLITFFYLLSLLIFKGPKILFVTVFAVLLGLIAISIVNKKVKASVHVAVISAFMLIIAILYKGPYLLSLMLVPIIGWSRVKTKKHTVLEVILGAILGGLLTFVVYFIGKLYFFKP